MIRPPKERTLRVLALALPANPMNETAPSRAANLDGDHPDAALVERLARGDAGAWRVLHRDHAADVYRLARRFVYSDTEAEEVTQEVFIAAYRYIERFRGQARLKTWLYRITVNRALKRRRWWRRRREIGEESLPIQEATVPGPEQRVIGRDQLRRLWQCLEKLEVRKRTVLVLHELEGLDTREIAEVLDCPRSTVLTRLARARADLVALAGRAGLEIPQEVACGDPEEA